MPKQPKMHQQLPDSPRPLPNNKEALTVLLRAVEKLLAFLEPSHHGQTIWLTELKRTLVEPRNIVQRSSFLQGIAKAHEVRFAQGGPSISAIVPYVDAARYRQLREKEQAARTRMKRWCRPNPPTCRNGSPVLKRLRTWWRASGNHWPFSRSSATGHSGPRRGGSTGETVHLTVPEIAKYILGPKIHKESAASSDRLIRKWISDGKLIVTKIKHGLYAVRTAHLEILKETNR